MLQHLLNTLKESQRLYKINRFMEGRKIIHTVLACGLFFAGFFCISLTYGEIDKHAEPKIVLRDTTSTIIFVGDIMLSRDIEKQMKKNADFSFPFRLIASTTSMADLTIGNLEGPISERGKKIGSIYSFRADPKVIEGLSFAGFDVLSLANNHMFDWGRDAISDTVSLLNDAGIKTVGAGRNEVEANEPVITNLKNAKVVVLSFTNLYPKNLWANGDVPGISRFIEDEIKEKIIKIRSEADIVIISIHWGDEYKTEANDYQKKFGRELIDAGADIVVGHHPHVREEIEQYKNGWIAYSLGNFVFDQYFSTETLTGALLEIKIKNKKIESVNARTVLMNSEFQPEEIK